MMQASKIVGGNGVRRERDFYPTPPECTKALAQYLERQGWLQKRHKIWEPACGEGHIVKVLGDLGYEAFGTDILFGDDFLTCQSAPNEFDWIITNPPFCLASEFIAKAYGYGKPFALLLKSQFWHSKKRCQLFNQCRPDLIMPLTWRPDFTGQGSSLMDMIWCVWLRGSQDGRTTNYIPLQKPNKED